MCGFLIFLLGPCKKMYYLSSTCMQSNHYIKIKRTLLSDEITILYHYPETLEFFKTGNMNEIQFLILDLILILLFLSLFL